MLEAAYAKLLKRHGFERIETGQLVDTYARSNFEDTRRKAQNFGARGTTLKAYKTTETVESEGEVVCEIDGEPLFRGADAATAAIDGLVRSHELVEQAVDDHDVRKHYANGTELVDDFAGKQRRLPEHALSQLRALTHTCLVRERCRLRRLQVR